MTGEIRKKVEELLKKLTLEEKASLCSGRDFWRTKAVERLGIPSVMMCDGPHGLRKQVGEGDHLGINESIKTVCYPTASAMASSFDRAAMEELGDALGRECQAEGVAMLLGPGVNMKRSPLCGRNFEYFSEDPYLAGELAAAYARALQKRGVSACVKHFAANNQEAWRMAGDSRVEERALHEIYFPAFEAAVKKGGARGVMCSYNEVNGVFSAVNRELLTDILRKRWGYEGMVVTDWGAVKDRVQGVEAGLDLEMPGGPGNQDADIVRAVKEGRLAESKLDEAAGNVLALVLGYEAERRPGAEIDRAECARLAEGLAARSAVLLKNEGGILPLKKEDDVAFIGEFARMPRYQGAGSSHINAENVTGAWEAAEKRGLKVRFVEGYRSRETDTDPALLNEAVQAAKNARVAVLFIGLPDAFETEGCDRENMKLPDNQNELVEKVAEAQPNTVVVLHGGSPMELNWLAKVRGALLMYLGGQGVGEACARLLWGEESPSGKLAETWPLRLEDTPAYLDFGGRKVNYREGVYIGYRYYDKRKLPVLFPFGHGLSYGRFEYSGLALDKERLEKGDGLAVTLRVKNTGERAGEEVVQLYVRPPKGEADRPVRELKEFAKVRLLPGEEKAISFRLDSRAFAYYEERIHDWRVEEGEYVIEIGASSRDIRLEKPVWAAGSGEIPVRYSLESPVADLQKTERGRAVFQQIVAASAAHMPVDNSEEVMGEGSAKMMERMMLEMPLRTLAGFGMASMEQLREMLQALNG